MIGTLGMIAHAPSHPDRDGWPLEEHQHDHLLLPLRANPGNRCHDRDARRNENGLSSQELNPFNATSGVNMGKARERWTFRTIDRVWLILTVIRHGVSLSNSAISYGSLDPMASHSGGCGASVSSSNFPSPSIRIGPLIGSYPYRPCPCDSH